MQFSQAIDRIKEDVPCVDVLRDAGHVIKDTAGNVPCPFHKEKTGSFAVNTRANRWRCFGACQAGGSVVDLVMRLRNLDFTEAVRDLAARAGITIDPPTPEAVAQLDADRRREEALSFAAAHYVKELSTEAAAYLAGRGLSETTITDHMLGYSAGTLLQRVRRHPSQLDAIGITEDDLVAAGILREVVKDGVAQRDAEGRKLLREHLRGRITFPFLRRGRVVGMAGRALDGDTEPKYLNLKAPMGTLYNDDDASTGEVILAEGQVDTLTLAQLGVQVVGVPGAGAAENYVGRLRRAKKVWVGFDNDTAGKAGAEKAAAAILKATPQCDVRVITGLPEGRDWSEYLATSEDAQATVATLKANAEPAMKWLIGRADLGTKSGEERSRAILDLLRVTAALDAITQAEAEAAIRAAGSMSAATWKDVLAKAKATLAAESRKQAGTAPTEPTFCFDVPDHFIPAQDFRLTGHPTANVTVYIGVNRPTPTDDGKVVDVKRIEPVIIWTRHVEGRIEIEAKPAADCALSARERARVPDEGNLPGRWVTDPAVPTSVQNYLAGKAPLTKAHEVFWSTRERFSLYTHTRETAYFDLLASFVMLSYVYQLFDTVPYVHLTGTRESGKSNIARVLESLCFNASKSSNSSGAVLFRGQEASAGVQILEEAERFRDPKPGTVDMDLSLMANDGYKRGAAAARLRETKGGVHDFTIVSFDIYGPRVLASINDLNYVLGSRCISILCERASRADLEAGGILDLTSQGKTETIRQDVVRSQIYAWAQQHFHEVADCYNGLQRSPDLGHLIGRERELWMPLLAVAYHVDASQAIGLAKGDRALAAGLFRSWTEEHSVFKRMIALQRRTEAKKRSVEADQSLEITVLKLSLIHI